MNTESLPLDAFTLRQEVDALLKRVKRSEKKCHLPLNKGVMDKEVYLLVRTEMKKLLKLREEVKAYLTDGKAAPLLFGRRTLLQECRANTRPTVRRCKNELKRNKDVCEPRYMKQRRVFKVTILPELQRNQHGPINLIGSEEVVALQQQQQQRPEIEKLVKAIESAFHDANAWGRLAAQMSSPNEIAVVKNAAFNRFQVFAVALTLAPDMSEVWLNLAATLRENSEFNKKNAAKVGDAEGSTTTSLGPSTSTSSRRPTTIIINNKTIDSTVSCLKGGLDQNRMNAVLWYRMGCALKGDQCYVSCTTSFTKRQCFFEAATCYKGSKAEYWTRLAWHTRVGDIVETSDEELSQRDCILKALNDYDNGGAASDERDAARAWFTLAFFMENDEVVQVAGGASAPMPSLFGSSPSDADLTPPAPRAYTKLEAYSKAVSLDNELSKSWAMLALLLDDTTTTTTTITAEQQGTSATSAATVAISDKNYTSDECLWEGFRQEASTNRECWAVAGRIIKKDPSRAKTIFPAAQTGATTTTTTTKEYFQRALRSNDDDDDEDVPDYFIWHWAAEALGSDDDGSSLFGDDDSNVVVEVGGKKYSGSECAAVGDRLYLSERAGTCSDDLCDGLFD